MLNELGQQLKAFEADNDAAVAVISGSGGNFSSGYDFDELRQNDEGDKIEKNLIVSPLLRHNFLFG